MKEVLARSWVVEARFETWRSVEVALVARRDETVVEARVEEAVAIRLLEPVNTMVVEVEFSPVPRVVNGKAKVEPPPQPVQLVTVRFPIEAMLALRSVVEAIPLA